MGVVEITNKELITVVAVRPMYVKVLKSVGQVKMIKKTIPGCFFKRGKSTKAFFKQKGVKIIKAITHL